jgi:hypothetical protein
MVNIDHLFAFHGIYGACHDGRKDVCDVKWSAVGSPKSQGVTGFRIVLHHLEPYSLTFGISVNQV